MKQTLWGGCCFCLFCLTVTTYPSMCYNLPRQWGRLYQRHSMYLDQRIRAVIFLQRFELVPFVVNNESALYKSLSTLAQKFSELLMLKKSVTQPYPVSPYCFSTFAKHKSLRSEINTSDQKLNILSKHWGSCKRSMFFS